MYTEGCKPLEPMTESRVRKIVQEELAIREQLAGVKPNEQVLRDALIEIRDKYLFRGTYGFELVERVLELTK